MRARLRSLIDRKIGRYLVCGMCTAAFNLVLLVIVIEGLGIQTTLGRSIANLVCTEISVLFSFFVYKILVWRDARWTPRELLARQLPIYHVSVAAAFFFRTIVAFPVLDALGVHYTINLLAGIVLSAAINFFISDRFVFRAPRVGPQGVVAASVVKRPGASGGRRGATR